MIIAIILLILTFFVFIPLYKAVRKQGEARRLNERLEKLADQYQRCLNTNDPSAEAYLHQAQQAVTTFNADVRLSAHELASVAPAITRFPFWYSWL